MSFNMSYCQCENTYLALSEVLCNMNEKGPSFISDLSREELGYFQQLFNACEDFINDAQELQNELDFGGCE